MANPQSPASKPGFWVQAIKWWPLLAALFAILVAGIETRIQVQSLISDKAVDTAQWVLIRKNLEGITKLEEHKEQVDRVITPESMQEWGWVKRTVEQNRREIEALKRRSNDR